MERKKGIIKKNNGITLIALVITIIILLILAGITIATLGGDERNIIKNSNSKRKTYKSRNERDANNGNK